MRKDLMGTPVDALDFDATIAAAEQAVTSRKKCVHVALNAAKFVKLQSDPELRSDVHGGDIVGVDGMGIVLAMKWLEGIEVERVPGVDVMMAMLELSAEKGYRPYILGAKEDVLQAAMANAKARWPRLEFAGSRNGYFGPEDESTIVASINAARPDCLFLAMPTPKKERFMAQHRDALDVPFIMGVGGSVDVLAGAVKRAPAWMQKSGLEWFYRLYQEPRKMFVRYASSNTKFLAIVLRQKLSS